MSAVPQTKSAKPAKAVYNWEDPFVLDEQLTEEERMIREFILQMKLGRVKAGYFQQKFGINIRERFAAPLAQIESEGLLHIEDTAILLTRDGLLCVDNLLHDFFLPHHHTDKIV